ncbi:MAG: cytochrome c [Alphaproteobacteria bacterium]|nr:cytochrome c [Alphaproteobacteria bacterium]
MRTLIIGTAALGIVTAMSAYSESIAATQRCQLHDGTKVVCPVRTDAELEAAAAAYEEEATQMTAGTSGSTYGVAPFDYLTGVGKRTEDTTLTKGDSGYGGKGGKTELWDRVNKPSADESVYNQWTNNWSPTFDTTLVPGADPNEGKQWYYVYCITCHGWGLQGDGPSAMEIEPRPRILTEGDYMNQKSNLQLFSVIKGGGEAVNLSSSMPAWGNFLQDQDIWNVVAWIRMMADSKPPTTIEEYLNPQTTFEPIAGDVDALTAAGNEDFVDAQEMNELSLAGRGEGELKGGGYIEGGLRKKPEEVAGKVKKGY